MDGSHPTADTQPKSVKPLSFKIKMDNGAIIFITFKDRKTGDESLSIEHSLMANSSD